MSSMADLMGALGGPGGGPGGPGGGPPPGLGPGGPPPGLGPGGPPPDAEDQQEGPEQYTDPVDALDDAEQALKAYLELEPDEGDRAVAATCLQNIVKLKAKDQKDQQQGNLPALQRALVGAAARGGPPGRSGGPPLG